MILKTLRKKFLEKEVKKRWKNRLPIHEGRPFRTLGIVINTIEFNNVDAFENLANALQILNKDLKIIYFTEENANLSSLEQNSFTTKDFSWNGLMKNPAILEFLDREYDVFICYSSIDSVFIDFIVSQAKATLKVGLDGANAALFDLIFKIKTNQYSLFEKELTKYLQIINKDNKN
ncbi:MAG: hypothetical protein CVU03_10030 [Bacteroidetes bacterium HGW-Bacteroidetes-2]|jgi:hypothetical protein|nr:MAG: hypothetical protein CVU03_10030 [Bacteroidetes bacterium HGW-Bacteroidetes-2]